MKNLNVKSLAEATKVPDLSTSHMNFVWSEFGVLDHWVVSEYGTLFIFNSQNECRKMSPKYSEKIIEIIEKSEILKGRNVQIRTSQNTGNYSSSEWFSDVSLADTAVNKQEQSMSDIESCFELKKKNDDLEKAFMEKDKIIEGEQKAKIDLEKRLKKTSDKAEKFQEKNTSLTEENIQLRNGYDELNRTQQDEVDEMIRELLDMGLVGTEKDVQCKKGHATKALALRLGINRENRGRINIHIKEHEGKNVYKVLLLDHGDREIQMALGIKNGVLHVRTVYSDLPDWETNLFEICGVEDKILKQSGDTYSHDFLVGYYKKVLKSLN